MAKLCLSMIVKNEADKIERALVSALPHLDAVVVLDTGSTDGTDKVIFEVCGRYKVPCSIAYGTFTNFEQARNDALAAAINPEYVGATCDYFLLMDADMQLHVDDKDFKAKLTEPVLQLMQKSASLDYYNTRIVSYAALQAGAKYRGVTHEYFDGPTPTQMEGVWFTDFADGTNRKNKFERDIRLLLAGLRAEPNNARYMYYLAQSYRDSGKWKEAGRWYKTRAALGGWEEEAWDAQLNYGNCLRNTGDEAGFIRETLAAYNRRPQRAEPLYDLARFYREKPNSQATAAMLAKTGMNIPYPKEDLLFVNRYVYTTGCKEEFAISGFYSKNKDDHNLAFEICDDLSLDMKGTSRSRSQAKSNLLYYLPKLGDLCSSFKATKLEFPAPDGYTAMNPSLCQQYADTLINVRCVNYTMDSAGRYLIRNTETGEITNDNPIHTRNFIGKLVNGKVEGAKELLPPMGLTQADAKYPLVIGLEDVRLFQRNYTLSFVACVRQANEDGWCEQWTGDINEFNNNWIANAAYRIPMNPRQHEKNWMPYHEGFAYRINRLVGFNGSIKDKTAFDIDTEALNGGTQIVPMRDGYVCIVHQSYHKPDGTRFYMHRFVRFNKDMLPNGISRPFCFLDRCIEFAAGLARGTVNQLVFSFGFQDKEAWIGEISMSDVEGMLCPI